MRAGQEEVVNRNAAVPPTTTDSVRSSNSGLASEILHGEINGDKFFKVSVVAEIWNI